MTPTARTLELEDLLAQSGWARGLARRLVGDDGLAEEVLQEAWVAALERAPRDRPLRSWFAVVVRNLALRLRRREAARGEVERRAARREGVPGGQQAVERLQLQRRLADALLALDEPYRSAVIARHLDGLSASEIARRQGCSPAAARQRVSRGLAALRVELDARSGGDRGAWCAAFAATWNLARGPLAPTAVASGAGVGLLGGVLVGSKWIALVAGLGLALGAWVWFAGEGPAPKPGAGLDAVAAPAPLAVPVAPPQGELARVASAADRERTSIEVSPPRPLRAKAGAALSGRVVNQLGVPVEGAEVTLLEADPRSGERSLGSALAQADGRFLIAPEGEPAQQAGWVLRAEHPGHLPARVLFDDPTELEIVLLQRPVVRGRLLGVDGTPLQPPGWVKLEVEQESGESQTERVEVDEQGRFETEELAPGRLVHISGRARGHGTGERALAIELAVGARHELDVSVSAGVVLRGAVVDGATQEPVPFAEVWAEGWQYDEASVEPSCVADALGQFEMSGAEVRELQGDSVPATMAWVSLTARAEGYVGKPWDFALVSQQSDGSYLAKIEVQRAEGSLRGHVTWPDGRPAGSVILYVLDARRNFSFSSTDEQGAYSIEGLPEGEVSLCLREVVQSGGGPRGIARALVQVPAGAHVTTDLVLDTSTGSISGRVLDQLGAPLAGVQIEAGEHFASEGLTIGLDSHRVHTDAEGRFQFRDLLPGRYQVQPLIGELRERVAAPSDIKIDLAGEQVRTDVDFTLIPAVQISGWIDFGEEPLEGLEVVVIRRADGQAEARQKPDAQGRFHFEGLYPEAYEVVLKRAGHEYTRIPVTAAGAAGLVLDVRSSD